MRLRGAAALGLSFAVLAAGCQLIAGLETRELGAPAAGASGAGAGGASAGGGGTSGGGGAGKGGSTGAGAGGSAGAGKAGAAGGPVVDPCMPQPIDGGVTPPDPPADGGKPAGGKSLFAAARRYFLGTIAYDPDPTKSTPDANAWKKIGYDIDHLCTTASGGSVSMAACVPAGVATNDLLSDGEACRDNAFGRFMSEKLGLLTPEKVVNDKIDAGAQTFLLQIDDIDPGSCDPHAPGKLFVTTATPTSPWLTATPREVDGRTVCNDDLALPKMTFPNAYIVADTWVSGPVPGSEMFTYFPLGTVVLKLRTRQPVLTAKLAPDHQSIVSSTMSLVIDPKQMLDQFRPLALSLNNCVDPGQIISTYIDTLLQYSDLVDAPGFVSPNKTCNLMSMGVGIGWTTVKPPSGVVVVPDEPLPCGGAGGVSGAGGAAGGGGTAGASAGGKAGAAGAGAAGATAGAAGSGGAAGSADACPPKAGSGGSAGAAGTSGGAGAGAGGKAGSSGSGGKGG